MAALINRRSVPSESRDEIPPGKASDENINVKHNVIGNDYFSVMQIPLLAGRRFGPQDTATSQRVAVISERMAKDLFPPGTNPIGVAIRKEPITPQEPLDGPRTILKSWES
jgi:hypothetical protein